MPPIMDSGNPNQYTIHPQTLYFHFQENQINHTNADIAYEDGTAINCD